MFVREKEKKVANLQTLRGCLQVDEQKVDQSFKRGGMSQKGFFGGKTLAVVDVFQHRFLRRVGPEDLRHNGTLDRFAAWKKPKKKRAVILSLFAFLIGPGDGGKRGKMPRTWVSLTFNATQGGWKGEGGSAAINTTDRL